MSAELAYLYSIERFQWDYNVRRAGGRVAKVIDFSIDDESLGLVRVEGDVVGKAIKTYDELGIAPPEGTGSPNGMMVSIAPGGTVRVRVSVPLQAFVPYAAYIAIYAMEVDMYVLPYVVLGGKLEGYRAKLPKRLRLPAGVWGRYVLHWFMELHHGQSEIVVEVYNPDTVDRKVVIGCIVVSEIAPFIKGHCMIFGWEDVFEMELNNETVTFNVLVFFPANVSKVVGITFEYGIAGDGTNPMNITVKIAQGGVTIINDSETSTTPKTTYKDLKICTARRGAWGLELVMFEVTLSTAGSGKLTKLSIVIKGASEEYKYQKYIEKTVSGGSTDMLIDLSNDIKHVAGAYLEITSPVEGETYILADTPEGEIMIAGVPRNATRHISIDGRYTYLKVRCTGSGTAVIRAMVTISDSYLLR